MCTTAGSNWLTECVAAHTVHVHIHMYMYVLSFYYIVHVLGTLH